jgi:hypothetical protein
VLEKAIHSWCSNLALNRERALGCLADSHADLKVGKLPDAFSCVQGVFHEFSDGGVQALAWLNRQTRDFFLN